MRFRLTSLCRLLVPPYAPRGTEQVVWHFLRRVIYSTVAATRLAVGTLSIAHAQDIEPRVYSNAPIGVNFLIAGYAYTKGAVPFDASLPVKNAQLKTSSAIFAYARVLDLWGKSAKLDAIVPYTWLSGSAELGGQPVERNISGFADSRFRLSVNLYGAPALTLKDFKNYKQDLIVGASLQVSLPSSQYDPSRVVNIGTNRWSFKPEVGISKALGPWTLEFQAAVTLFTDNTDFFGGNTRSQDPIYSTQGHAIYGFRSGIWGSLDVTYFTGGRTTLEGTRSDDLQENWRVGGTLAFPVDLHNSVKLYASNGVSARTNNNYDLIGIAWQYRWGGGL
jgi:Putative MetA-pathway of phenol degradation